MENNVITRETDFFADMISKIKTMETEIERMQSGNLTCAPKWLTSETVIKKLGISRRTLQTYRDKGILPYSVVIGKFFYNSKDIDDLMRDNYVKF